MEIPLSIGVSQPLHLGFPPILIPLARSGLLPLLLLALALGLQAKVKSVHKEVIRQVKRSSKW
jgi:hypothetical protein